MLDAAVEVAVIGAGGPAGLASCKEAKLQGMKVTGFESSQGIGGIWNTDPASSRVRAHSGLVTNISRFLSTYPDFPWPKNTPAFPNTEEMFDYLNAYAEHFDLKKVIQFGCHVTKVSREGDKWVVEWTKDNLEYKKSFDAIIVATGQQSKPSLPDFQGLDQIPKEKKMHSADFKISDDFTNKRVLVIGGSISGTDLAEKLAKSSAHVTHLLRRSRWQLRKYLSAKSGQILPWDIADTFEPNAKTLTPEEKFQHFSTICQLQQQYPEWKMTEEVPFGIVFVEDYLERVKEKRIAPVRGEIDHFTDKNAVLKSGQEISYDLVVFCTGYTSGMPSFLPIDISIDPKQNGLYLQMFPRNTIRIAVLGLPPYTRLSFLAQQAEAACHIFSGKGELPSEEELQADIERIKTLAPVDYMNKLAKVTGSFLDIEQFEKENPQLCGKLKSFPFLPSQNKLTGPYSNPAAATEIINDAYEYLQSVPKAAKGEVNLAVNVMVANDERARRRSGCFSDRDSNLENEKEKIKVLHQ